MSPNIVGALLMMGSMTAFTINDTFLKLTDGAVPLFQLLFLRGMMASALIYGLARYYRALRWDMPRADWGLVALRSGSEMGAAYFFLTALFHMPLPNVTAILQVLPLTVTMGAALFFGESVGWRRWTAIAVGFLGMLLIVQPGSAGFTGWSVYALIAVVFVTARDLATRKMSKEAPSLLVTLVGAMAVTGFSGIASIPQGWAPVSAENWGYLIASAAIVLFAYIFSVTAMRQGEVSFIAPFRYTSLVAALLLGWFVFGDWPAPLVWLGGGLVVAAGLFTFARERRAKDLPDPV